jgi:hypothetical protein
VKIANARRAIQGDSARTKKIHVPGVGLFARVLLEEFMIRKLKSGGYRIYSRKADSLTGRRRNLGTFPTRERAMKHEREIEYFKRVKR